MKKCIWCSLSEPFVTFKNKAHTIPQSLGGENICENICDSCNSYFGKHSLGSPSIETIIKETFNLSRTRLLNQKEYLGNQKKQFKFSSVFFSVNNKTNKLSLKLKYQLFPSFQEKIGRQMKKGIYKIFLEETERQKGTAHDPKYDFIREYARYNFGDYPLIYFERKFGVFMTSQSWVEHPVLFLDGDQPFKYLISTQSFFEFELLGHVFGIATSKSSKLVFDDYIKKTIKAKKQFFRGLRVVEKFNDVDLSLSILDDHYRPLQFLF